MQKFRDRVDAGRRLARRLEHLRGRDVVVLGLPRGGVPVAAEVADALGAPLDVVVVRKLGLPSQPELAMGAIGEGGFRVVDQVLVARARITRAQWRAVEDRERRALEERVGRLRRGRPRPGLRGRVAVVVDDGIATGATARVACEAVRALGASTVVLAVPVAPVGLSTAVPGADEVVCLRAARRFGSVGQYYVDFFAVGDDEVVALLTARAGPGSAAPGCGTDRTAGGTSPSR